jgi:hypothetical protein
MRDVEQYIRSRKIIVLVGMSIGVVLAMMPAWGTVIAGALLSSTYVYVQESIAPDPSITGPGFESAYYIAVTSWIAMPVGIILFILCLWGFWGLRRLERLQDHE